MSDRRDENVRQLAEQIAIRLVEELRNGLQTCITCEHFDEPREICNLAAKRPPAKVIAYGCNAWKERTPF